MTKSEWYAKLQKWAFDDPRLNRMPLIFLDPLAELLANDQEVEQSVHPTAFGASAGELEKLNDKVSQIINRPKDGGG